MITVVSIATSEGLGGLLRSPDGFKRGSSSECGGAEP